MQDDDKSRPGKGGPPEHGVSWSEKVSRIFRKVRPHVEKGISATVTTASDLKKRYEDSEYKPRVDRAVDATVDTAIDLKERYDDSQLKPAVDMVVGTTGDALDIVSGKRLLELVEARLELQAKYNDILATKLDEALRRIEALEAALRKERP